MVKGKWLGQNEELNGVWRSKMRNDKKVRELAQEEKAEREEMGEKEGESD